MIPEGHIWTVSQAVNAVSGRRPRPPPGLKITGVGMMARFDLEGTYLQPGRPRRPGAPIPSRASRRPSTPTPRFWAPWWRPIGSTEDWPNWEMHPGGEEVLVLLDGRMTLILDEPGGERRVEMAPAPPASCRRAYGTRPWSPSPPGSWRITYGAGTHHRPL